MRVITTQETVGQLSLSSISLATHLHLEVLHKILRPEADDVQVADGVPGCARDLLHGVCRTATFSLRILENGSAVMFPQEKSSTNIKVCLQPSGTDLRTRIKCPKDDFVKKGSISQFGTI